MKEKEENMRKLVAKKHLYSPIDFDEIDSHQERYEDYKKQREDRREMEQRMKIKAEEERKK